MAVHRFLGAIFNLVTRWESEDRLEEGLYRTLDSLKAPVPLIIGEAFLVVIYCTAPLVDQKSRSKWATALRYAAANKRDVNRYRALSSGKAASTRALPGMPSTFGDLVKCSGVLRYFRG